MGHLVPIWQITCAAMILPKGVGIHSFSSLNQINRVVAASMLALLVISTMYCINQTISERPVVKQDVRASIEYISEDWRGSLSNAIITQPSPHIYQYYLDRYELEPEYFEGSWGKIEAFSLEEIISSQPDVIYRVRMMEFDDSESFISSVSEHYVLLDEISPTGMVVQKWVLSEALQ